MKFKKLVSTTLLISLLCSGIPAAYADEQVCFTEPVAKELLTDITVYKTEAPLLKEAIELQKQKIEGLSKDKEEFKKETEQYKKLYISENKAHLESEASKPSRFVWFSIGGITTAIAIIAAVFATR